jgi:hypothetical protein
MPDRDASVRYAGAEGWHKEMSRPLPLPRSTESPFRIAQDRSGDWASFLRMACREVICAQETVMIGTTGTQAISFVSVGAFRIYPINGRYPILTAAI